MCKKFRHSLRAIVMAAPKEKAFDLVVNVQAATEGRYRRSESRSSF